MNLIQVHIGKKLPDYFIDSIYQTLLIHKYSLHLFIILSDELISQFNKEFAELNLRYYLPDFIYENIVTVVPSSILQKNLDINISYSRYSEAIYKYSLEGFRDSFWISTTARFFFLAECYKVFLQDKKNVVHIENDVMLYHNLSEIIKTFSHSTSSDIYMVKDSPERVVPSILIFNSLEAALKLTAHISKTLSNSSSFLNDMNILATYPDLIPLKFNPFSYSTETNYIFDGAPISYIFDGAAIGQYLSGVDPRNIPNSNRLTELNNPTKGFINETCEFKIMKNEDINQVKMKGDVNQVKNENVNQVKMKGELISYQIKEKPIVNLHIHSKQLYQFSSIFDIKFDEMISGTRILQQVDFILLTPQVNAYHLGIDHLNHKKIMIPSQEINDSMVNELVKHIKNVKQVSLFIYTHTLPLMKKIFTNSGTYTLFFGNTDHEFLDQDIIKEKCFTQIFAQNPSCPLNLKVNLLPIGIANSMFKHGDMISLYSQMAQCYRKKKKKNIYINLSEKTYQYRS